MGIHVSKLHWRQVSFDTAKSGITSFALIFALIACNSAPMPASTNREPIVNDPSQNWNSTVNASGIDNGYLSDQTWLAATNGWGPVEKDLANGDDGTFDGDKIQINGVVFEKGLGTHTNSSIEYHLSGSCSSFTASVGVDDAQKYAPKVGGTVVFQVFIDGTERFNSGVMKRGMGAQNLKIDLRGAERLQLVATDAGDGVAFDHANWANAQIMCTESKPPPPNTGLKTGQLSDQFALATVLENGWGDPQIDRDNGDSAPETYADKYKLQVNGVIYEKGLGVHANSTIEFPLDGQCSSFNALVGADDGTKYNLKSRGGGTVAFQVFVDNAKKFDSGLVKRGEAAKGVNVVLTGGQKLKLVATDGGDGSAFDHADWINAMVKCGDAVSNPPVNPPSSDPPPSNVEYKGVSAAMWAEIDARAAEFGDWHNCHARINAIPNTGYTITPSNGNAINQALTQSNTVILKGGTYRISSTLELAGKKLIGAPGEDVTINAIDVATAVTMGNDSVLANVKIIDAGNVGIQLSSNDVLYRVSVARTGRSSYLTTDGRGIRRVDDNSANNCLVSTESRDSYNDVDYTGGYSFPTTVRGGNGDGYVISGSTIIDSYAYNNSDDGFDSWEAQPNYFYFSEARDGGQSSLGFPEGYNNGDGNGFKLGRGNQNMYIYKSKAYNNKQSGFDANGSTAYGSFVIMCSESYGNGTGSYGQDWAQGLTGNTRSCP
jgi:NPCBM/NEW2 domain